MKVAKFNYLSKHFCIEGTSENDHIYKQICTRNTFYEIDLLEYIYQIRSFVNSKGYESVAIDAGANIGNHSIYLNTFLVDHLIAIEPNPNVLPQLKRNLSTNALSYRLFECAVGAEKRKGNITLAKDFKDNVGAAKVEASNNEGQIQILTLDSVFDCWQNDHDNPICLSLIKMDIEGMELKALKGAERTISEHRPHIFVEAGTKEQLEKIDEYLGSLDYKRMPGSWAATPVYHFAFNPVLSLTAVVHYYFLRKKVRRLMSKLKVKKRVGRLVSRLKKDH